MLGIINEVLLDSTRKTAIHGKIARLDGQGGFFYPVGQFVVLLSRVQFFLGDQGKEWHQLLPFLRFIFVLYKKISLKRVFTLTEKNDIIYKCLRRSNIRHVHQN